MYVFVLRRKAMEWVMEHIKENSTLNVLLIVVYLWNCHVVSLMIVSMLQRRRCLMDTQVKYYNVPEVGVSVV